MEQHHYGEVDAVWKPILVTTEQPDAGWIWDYKLRQAQRDERYEAYALFVDEFPQGLLFLETQWHRSYWSQRWPLVYVEVIATAPWNRVVIEQPPWFKRVGASLLLFARQRSVDLGYEGRIGLHSLTNGRTLCAITDHRDTLSAVHIKRLERNSQSYPTGSVSNCNASSTNSIRRVSCNGLDSQAT